MTDTRTDDQIAELFARANPVPRHAPADTASDPAPPPTMLGGDPVDAGGLVPGPGRDRSRGSWALVAGVAAVVALVVSLLVVSISGSEEPAPADQPGPSSTTPESERTAAPDEQVAVATRFWTALEAGDRDAAMSLVDPGRLDVGAARVVGRAHTLEGQFDWYEAVGWQWEFDGCERARSELVECTASASDEWSRALDVDPLTSTFIVRFTDDGIVSVNDDQSSFGMTWARTVEGVFHEWVRTHHPEDAEMMLDSTTDVNPEILRLYEINTERFVEAHSS